jgi:diacylglycerol kinase (ATP)
VSAWGVPVLIANPAAGRGSAAKLLVAARAQLEEVGMREFLVTRKEGDEETLASSAISRGVRSFVVLGGDGTCSRVANAILKSGVDCLLTVLPSGTGNDFAKTLGLNGATPSDVAGLVTGGTVVRIDVGTADDKYFLNSCGFGFDASVLEATQKVRFLKGDTVYIYSALKQLFSYQGIEIVVTDGGASLPRRMLMVTVSNGRYLGGAFKIAPNASVLDGKLDACFFSDSNVVERARLFVGALRGTHLGMRAVTNASVHELALTFATPPAMEIDGELRTAASATVKLKCLPHALSVVAAPGAIL